MDDDIPVNTNNSENLESDESFDDNIKSPLPDDREAVSTEPKIQPKYIDNAKSPIPVGTHVTDDLQSPDSVSNDIENASDEQEAPHSVSNEIQGQHIDNTNSPIPVARHVTDEDEPLDSVSNASKIKTQDDVQAPDSVSKDIEGQDIGNANSAIAVPTHVTDKQQAADSEVTENVKVDGVEFSTDSESQSGEKLEFNQILDYLHENSNGDNEANRVSDGTHGNSKDNVESTAKALDTLNNVHPDTDNGQVIEANSFANQTDKGNVQPTVVPVNSNTEDSSKTLGGDSKEVSNSENGQLGKPVHVESQSVVKVKEEILSPRSNSNSIGEKVKVVPVNSVMDYNFPSCMGNTPRSDQAMDTTQEGEHDSSPCPPDNVSNIEDTSLLSMPRSISIDRRLIASKRSMTQYRSTSQNFDEGHFQVSGLSDSYDSGAERTFDSSFLGMIQKMSLMTPNIMDTGKDDQKFHLKTPVRLQGENVSKSETVDFNDGLDVLAMAAVSPHVLDDFFDSAVDQKLMTAAIEGEQEALLEDSQMNNQKKIIGSLTIENPKPESVRPLPSPPPDVNLPLPDIRGKWKRKRRCNANLVMSYAKNKKRKKKTDCASNDISDFLTEDEIAKINQDNLEEAIARSLEAFTRENGDQIPSTCKYILQAINSFNVYGKLFMKKWNNKFLLL